MFNLRKFLILLGSFLFLASIISPLVMIPLLLLIATTFPLLGVLFLGIWFKREIITRSQRAITIRIDPDYGKRSCPDCGESVSLDEIVCPNCYEELAINCPECGEILYKKRDRCPSCNRKLNHQRV